MARIHLLPLPSAAIVVPLDTVAQRTDPERLDRARHYIRALVNNLQLGGGLNNERAWDTVSEAFIDEAADRLGEESAEFAEDAIGWFAAELRRRSAIARKAVA